MRDMRLHTAVLGALVVTCLVVACSPDPAADATLSPTPLPPATATPTATPAPTPTPMLPVFETSGNAGGLVGDSASEFTGIANWINSEPLTMEGLRGRVVLIDFWTYT